MLELDDAYYEVSERGFTGAQTKRRVVSRVCICVWVGGCKGGGG